MALNKCSCSKLFSLCVFFYLKPFPEETEKVTILSPVSSDSKLLFEPVKLERQIKSFFLLDQAFNLWGHKVNFDQVPQQVLPSSVISLQILPQSCSWLWDLKQDKFCSLDNFPFKVTSSHNGSFKIISFPRLKMLYIWKRKYLLSLPVKLLAF